jgi:probable HAF family extracellular repeat protein
MHGRLLRNFSLGLLGAVFIALAISMFTATTATTSFYYSVTDLGTLGGNYSGAYDINDMEQVVGSSATSSGNHHAFLWQNGAMQDLGTLGGTWSHAWRINKAGQVVGQSSTSDGKQNAFVWQNTTMIGLFGSDSNYSIARDINNIGQVVGKGNQGAFLWSNGTTTNLGNLVGTQSTSLTDSGALGINDAGLVVGWSNYNINSVSTHAFLRDNDTMTDLTPNNGYHRSAAISINKAGEIVGDSSISGRFHAILWKNAMMSDLGTLANKDSSEAYDINDAGTVVGMSYTYNPNPDYSKGEDEYKNPRAFVWKDGTIQDLTTLLSPNSGWELTSAWGINNNGQIVGTGTFNGQSRAYLLMPITVIN